MSVAVFRVVMDVAEPKSLRAGRKDGRENKRTRTEGVVGPLELLAGSEVLALGGDALEVVGVVLEAGRPGMSSQLKSRWVVKE